MSSRPPEPPYDPYERGDPRDQRDRRFDPRDVRHSDRPDERIETRRRRPPLWVILAGLVALILVILFAVNLTRGGPGEDRLDDNSASSSGSGSDSAAAADPAERCASKQTYDQVKAELFRQAAATRGNDKAVFDRLQAYATLRMQNPVLKRQDEGLGTLVCSGRASIDLPPGLVVAGGRTALTADLDYALQNAADGSGQVVTLAGADAITVPLATLSRSTDTATTAPDAVEPAPAAGAEPGQPAVPDQAPPAPPAPATPVTPAAPAAPPQASASPAFNCRYARTRGEIAVCNDDGLALLDRRMSSIYVDALRQGSPDQDALLRRTRDRFLGYRDRCGNNACIAGAYRDRIREISDIMAGRWQP